MEHVTNTQPSKVDYALALASYRKEQGAMRDMVGEVFGKYGKPQMSVEELRELLESQLGEVSLSREIIKMREEGY